MAGQGLRPEPEPGISGLRPRGPPPHTGPTVPEAHTRGTSQDSSDWTVTCVTSVVQRPSPPDSAWFTAVAPRPAQAWPGGLGGRAEPSGPTPSVLQSSPPLPRPPHQLCLRLASLSGGQHSPAPDPQPHSHLDGGTHTPHETCTPARTLAVVRTLDWPPGHGEMSTHRRQVCWSPGCSPTPAGEALFGTAPATGPSPPVAGQAGAPGPLRVCLSLWGPGQLLPTSQAL